MKGAEIWFSRRAMAGGLLLLATVLLGFSPARAEDEKIVTDFQKEPVLMYYGVELVSNYVVRGDDHYVRAFTRDAVEHGSFNAVPALRPSVIFFSDRAAFYVTGTFAMLDREDDPDNVNGAFYGFARDDAIDYRLAYIWYNRLGKFTGALNYYTYLDAAPVGPGQATPNVSGDPSPTEMMVQWRMPWLRSLSPTLARYGRTTPGQDYTSMAMRGYVVGVTWDATLGYVRTGPKDLTLDFSYELAGFNLGAHMAYRPKAGNLAFNAVSAGPRGYTPDGTYIPDLADLATTADYPPMIFWFSLSWGQRIR